MAIHCTSNITRAALPCLGIFVVVLSLSPAVEAGVFDVDSTSTAKGLEIKGKFYSTHSSDEQTWRMPGISVSGRISDNLEWGVGSGYGAVRKEDGPTRGGLRDFSVGTKWRFLDHGAQSGVTMAIEPEFTFPTGNESSGVGDGAVGFELPLRVAKRMGRVRVTGQVSMERTFGRDDDSVGAGVLTEYAVSDQWSYGIEFVADAPSKQMGAYHLRSNVGFTWEPSEQFELQMLAGRSLDNRRGGPATSFRLVLEYRP
jgi:hypothetical protein